MMMITHSLRKFNRTDRWTCRDGKEIKLVAFLGWQRDCCNSAIAQVVTQQLTHGAPSTEEV